MKYSIITWRAVKLLILFFLLSQEVKAQYYEIVHDIQKDTTIFYKTNLNKNNKTKNRVSISKIRSRKHSDIHLSVENINPFTWKASITPVKRAVSEESENSGLIFTNIIAGLGGSNFKELTKLRASESTEIAAKKAILERKYIYLQQSVFELKELKYDKLKSEATIKSKAEEIKKNVAESLNIEVGKDNIDFNSAMRISGSTLDKQATALEINMEEENTFSDFHSNISKTYNEIVSAKFTFEKNFNRSQVDSIEGFILEIKPVDTTLSAQIDPVVRYFPLRTKPRLKLGNSTGITFTYFEDNNRSYYVKSDSTIGSGSNDLFTPVLSAFINFYSNRIYGFKWGGTFGVGLPIFQESDGKNYLNFMLGMCTVLGRNDPVIISAGIAGTKVNRLSNGLKVGSIVSDPTEDLKYQGQFRVGGFVSISFNISNLTKKSVAD